MLRVSYSPNDFQCEFLLSFVSLKFQLLLNFQHPAKMKELALTTLEIIPVFASKDLKENSVKLTKMNVCQTLVKMEPPAINTLIRTLVSVR